MLHITNIPQTRGNVQYNICVVNFFDKNWNITKKNPEAQLGASKEDGPARGETKYILMSHHHSAEQSNNTDR
jgi:hypothetical protein